RALDIAIINELVSGNNDKKRFSRSGDGLSIRALQGHSASTVSIQHVVKTPPDLLYHGTATRCLDSIQKKGLISGARHHVHLSEDITIAAAVGQRYGTPVVLSIDALSLSQQGYVFYQADNGVWLTGHVPADFILTST